MVFDNIKNKDLYLAMHPSFKAAFNYIEKVVRDGEEVGKYEIDGRTVHAMVQEYEGKEDHPKYEGHRRYIDIQFILSGKEIMDYANIAECDVMTEYNADKDVEFFTCDGIKTRIEAQSGDFAIFYPEDIHKPGIKYEDGTMIKKIVVKVLV